MLYNGVFAYFCNCKCNLELVGVRLCLVHICLGAFRLVGIRSDLAIGFNIVFLKKVTDRIVLEK